MSEDRLRAAIALYDRFTHGGLDRRAFMTGLTRIAGGVAAANLLLSSIAADAQAAPQVAADDPRIAVEEVAWEAGPGRLYPGYQTSPSGNVENPPAVIVIHENRGLNEHIRRCRAAARGGGLSGDRARFPSAQMAATPADQDRARQMIGALDLARTVADGAAMIAALRTRRDRPGASASSALLGRGDGEPARGGGRRYACRRRLILWSGPRSGGGGAGARGDADHSGGPRRAGEHDRSPLGRGIARGGQDGGAAQFPDVDHAFHNDMSAQRYNDVAAQAAWPRRSISSPATCARRS